MHQAHIRSGGRYPVLRTVAILWLVGAVFTLIYGIYGAICAAAGISNRMAMSFSDSSPVPLHAGNTPGQRIISCCLWLAATFFTVLFTVGVAELIKLLMDMAESMRISALSGMSREVVAPAPTDGAGRIFTEETAEGALLRGH